MGISWLKGRLPGCRVIPALLGLALLLAWLAPVVGASGEEKQPLVYFGHGGQGTVSGSLHVLEHGQDLYLIDVGTFFGGAGANYPWPEDIAVEAIRAVFITHAHADHLGRLPLLLHEGYRGPIYMTRVTYEIAEVTMPANLGFADFGPERFYYSRHNDGRSRIPVYLEGYDFGAQTVRPENRVYFTAHRSRLSADGYYLARPQRQKLAQELRRRLDRQVVIVDPGEPVAVEQGRLQATFLPTPHIPGSAMVRLLVDDQSLLFSGDVGAGSSPLLPSPPRLKNGVDFLFLEGTMAYDRPDGDLGRQRSRFGRNIGKLATAGKRVVIPAFVLDRSQQVMFELGRAIDEGYLPVDQVIRVCSPTANQLLELYDDFAGRLRRELTAGNHEEPTLSPFFTPKMAGAEFLPPGYLGECSGEEPDNPLGLEPGDIGIMASGMADFSAARRALLDYLDDSNTVFYFVGYQSPDSLGGRLTAGEEPPVVLKIGDERRRVRAAVKHTGAFGSHADPAAMERIFAATEPEKIFLVHLEKKQGKQLAERYHRHLGPEVVVPRPGRRYPLSED